VPVYAERCTCAFCRFAVQPRTQHFICLRACRRFPFVCPRALRTVVILCCLRHYPHLHGGFSFALFLEHLFYLYLTLSRSAFSARARSLERCCNRYLPTHSLPSVWDVVRPTAYHQLSPLYRLLFLVRPVLCRRVALHRRHLRYYVHTPPLTRTPLLPPHCSFTFCRRRCLSTAPSFITVAVCHATTSARADLACASLRFTTACSRSPFVWTFSRCWRFYLPFANHLWRLFHSTCQPAYLVRFRFNLFRFFIMPADKTPSFQRRFLVPHCAFRFPVSTLRAFAGCPGDRRLPVAGRSAWYLVACSLVREPAVRRLLNALRVVSPPHAPLPPFSPSSAAALRSRAPFLPFVSERCSFLACITALHLCLFFINTFGVSRTANALS